MSTQLYPHISADADMLGGQPVIEGTSVPVSLLVSQVAAGKGLDEVAREHGVTVEDVRAALEYAAQLAEEPPLDLPDATPSVPEEPDELTPAGADEARRLGLDPANMSPLGRSLINIRAEMIASGEPLLTWDELDAEMREQRHRDYYDDE